MHIAILMTNTDESAFSQAHPKDGEKFKALLAPLRPDWRFSVFEVKDGVFPPGVDGFDGFIITGSPASVHDKAPWVERLFGLIREIVDRGVPLFGACFGHQAIAMALGGDVGANPEGWVLGIVETDYTEPAPWMAGDSAQIRLYAAHLEQVTALPEGARVLGGTRACPIGSFAIREHVFTTQYHPEMTHGFMAALTKQLDGKLTPKATATAQESLAEKAETDRVATWIIAFFEYSRE
ncbi:MAG: type 1 glutamine amidotransferase [Paracoccaceae bacterium]